MGPTFPKGENWLELSSFPMIPPWFPEALFVFNFPTWLCKLSGACSPGLGYFELCLIGVCQQQSVTVYSAGSQAGLLGSGVGLSLSNRY